VTSGYKCTRELAPGKIEEEEDVTSFTLIERRYGFKAWGESAIQRLLGGMGEGENDPEKIVQEAGEVGRRLRKEEGKNFKKRENVKTETWGW